LQSKKQKGFLRGYQEIWEENPEKELIDYQETADSNMGNYRCRDCGVTFETLEEHDLHLRQVHGRAEVLQAGISL
jgi:hypothetical protein